MYYACFFLIVPQLLSHLIMSVNVLLFFAKAAENWNPPARLKTFNTARQSRHPVLSKSLEPKENICYTSRETINRCINLSNSCKPKWKYGIQDKNRVGTLQRPFMSAFAMTSLFFNSLNPTPLCFLLISLGRLQE